MKKLCLILFGFIMMQTTLNQTVVAKGTNVLQDKIDTAINSKEDKVIEDVIKSKTPVKKEKVEYLSQVTRYGFKNLFKNYSYNAAMPYSSQVNPYAENYMEDYLQSHTKYLQNLQKTALPYFNFIDGILTHYGLPRELKYLAVIESNLKPYALSSAGARGPWQFMSYTARDYGLQVNQMVDDRIDYYKSTNAAAKYLLTLYKDLKDWLLVIAAYNGGPGRVYSAIRKSGSRNFWNLQYYLPEESRNHVKKFIATHYIMENAGDDKIWSQSKFNYSKLSTEKTLSTPQLSEAEKSTVAEMQLSGRYKAQIIAKNIDMELKDFEHYNPGFDNLLATGATYNLRLPDDKMTLFTANKYPILNECVQQLLGNVDMDTKTVYKRKFDPSAKKK
ncbi:MAG TPA: lytic transglycosylase domain-containing protein [Hanamia sp.]|nr:lytic transglycosylase domain-containing protein [Hanamia sp.]